MADVATDPTQPFNSPPGTKRWADFCFKHEPLWFKLNLGSVFTRETNDMILEAHWILRDVARIVQSDWIWYTAEETTYEKRYSSELVGDCRRKEGDDELVNTPVDQCRFLHINFASKDDAMLVRMTIADLRRADHVDSGGLPTRP